MSELTLEVLNQQLMKLYEAKEYAQAFEQAEREQTNFPGIAYWRLCLHTLVGKRAEALHLFREIVDQGGWFGPMMLERDPDLVDLRPLPEFQEMLEVCRRRLEEAKDAVRPELLVEEPAEQAMSLPLLMALHGNEGKAYGTIDEWREVTAQGWLLGVPTSSQIVAPDCFVWDERKIGTSEVLAHLSTLNSEHAINQERVVLGGYSMGGGLAIWMALHQSIKTCGFVVLAPYLTPDELEALAIQIESQRPSNLRGTILVGEKDIECLEVSRQVVALMSTHHLPCELEIHPGSDHSYPSNFDEYLRRGLTFVEAQ